MVFSIHDTIKLLAISDVITISILNFYNFNICLIFFCDLFNMNFLHYLPLVICNVQLKLRKNSLFSSSQSAQCSVKKVKVRQI